MSDSREKPAGSPSVGWPAYVVKLRDRLEGHRPPAPTGPFVLLVTGSQSAEEGVWGDVVTDCLAEVNRWLFAHGRADQMKTLRHGGARGIDSFAHARGRQFGYSLDRIPTEWRHWGRRSAILRNQFMVERYPYPDLCLAFFAGSTAGTANCAAQAHRAGILTVPITVEDLYLPHTPV